LPTGTPQALRRRIASLTLLAAMLMYALLSASAAHSQTPPVEGAIRLTPALSNVAGSGGPFTVYIVAENVQHAGAITYDDNRDGTPDRSEPSTGMAAFQVTIEYDPVRAKQAAANIQKAGLSDIVRVVAGDAFKEIPRVPGNFDFVFLDAWKPDYKKFFDLVFPRVTPGGLFLAHNVINKKNDMPDFLAAIRVHPQALSTTVSPGHEGISITYKKR